MEVLFRRVALPETPLLLNTHGAYHHLTYGVLTALEPEDIGYVHIDYHADAEDDLASQNTVSFASFVPDIAALPHVEDMVTIGSYYPPFHAISAEHLVEGGWRERLQDIIDKLPDQLYISVDLDVFHHGYLHSTYPQGVMNWQQFETVVRQLRDAQQVIGGDVVGIEPPAPTLDQNTYRAAVRTLQGRWPDNEDHHKAVRQRMQQAEDDFYLQRARTLYAEEASEDN